jgi:hypothetical protein
MSAHDPKGRRDEIELLDLDLLPERYVGLCCDDHSIDSEERVTVACVGDIAKSQDMSCQSLPTAIARMPLGQPRLQRHTADMYSCVETSPA